MYRTIARLAGALVAVATTVGLVFVTSPSYAINPEGIATARHSLLGKSVHNIHTNLTVTTIGTYQFYRKYKGKKVPFYGFVVSAQKQHGPNGNFYGPVKEGRILPPHQEGNPASKVAKAGSSFCLPNTAACADPWNWIADNFSKPYTEVNNHITKPCVSGALVGYGGVGSTKLAAWMLYNAGAIAKAAAKKAILGPEGAGVVALGGCFIATAKQATDKWQDIYNQLFFH
jgi:hypothetical protein